MAKQRITAEQARIAGRRKKRWHKLLAWSVNFINAWLEAGRMVANGDGSYTKYDVIDVTPQELKFINGQMMRFKNWRDKFCDDIDAVKELTAAGKSFYKDATSDLQLVKAACEVYAPKMTHTENLRVQTYLLYAFMHDLTNVTGGAKTRNHKLMLQTLETLVNKLLPQDSPLVLIMNKVYWTTRDVILVDPKWPDSYYDLATFTPQEDFISKPANRRDCEAARKLFAWKHNTPKIERNAAA